MLAEGGLAPDFELEGWSLAAALKNAPVLLAFFKISCPTCQFAFPFLQRLADGAAPGITPGRPQIVVVSQDDVRGTKQFADRFGIALPTLHDEVPGYRVSNLYGIRNVPTLYLIEPARHISLAVAGFGKAQFETLAARFGTAVFREGEAIPAFRPG
jgi:thiol-disulfide isomerase/thioredoxin